MKKYMNLATSLILCSTHAFADLVTNGLYAETMIGISYDCQNIKSVHGQK